MSWQGIAKFDGLEPTQELRERRMVVAEALSWLKTPYHHRGTVKGAGVDCGGLLFEVFAVVGLIEHRAVPEYAPDWHLHQGDEWYYREMLRYCQQVEDRDPLPGDIIMYRYGRVAAHSAIVVDWPQIIHAYHGLGVVLGNGASDPIARRQVAVFSFWGRK